MAGKKATPKKKVEDSEAPHMPTSTPKRVNRPAAPKSSPTKSTPAKLKSRATSDESLLFLYHCLRHNGGSQVSVLKKILSTHRPAPSILAPSRHDGYHLPADTR